MQQRTPIRFGIIGAGMVADYHRQAIRQLSDEGAELTCVVHHDPSRFDAISSRFGVECVDEDDLLSNPGVDAICICTPSGQHAAQAIAAARAGKHVLVEKPMALSLADAQRMTDACADAGVSLGIVYQRRFDPVFQSVRERIENGDLGELTMAVLSMPYFRGDAYYAAHRPQSALLHTQYPQPQQSSGAVDGGGHGGGGTRPLRLPMFRPDRNYKSQNFQVPDHF